MNKKILTGQTNEHVKIFWEGQLNLIPEVAEAFLDMSSAAKKDGLVLSVVSTFRSFDDQLRIWNQKFKGTMDVLDLNEEKITIGNLNEFEKIEKGLCREVVDITGGLILMSLSEMPFRKI